MLTNISQSKRLTPFVGALKAHQSLLVEQLWDTPKALLLALAYQASGKHLLILTSGSRETRLYDDLSYFHSGPIIELPAWETLPSENIAPSPDIAGQRYEALHRLVSSKEKQIILCPLQACLQRTLLPERLLKSYLSCKVGEEISFEQLQKQLLVLGYQQRPVVSEKGEFAVRGGIIDLFPIALPNPVRLEFYGDKIESLRLFDPVGQKSIEKIAAVTITPATEMEMMQQEARLASILEYLDGDALVVFDDVAALEDRAVELQSLRPAPSPSFASLPEFLAEVEKRQKLFFVEQPIEALNSERIAARDSKISFQFFEHTFTAERWHHPFLRVAPFLLPEHTESVAAEDDLLLAAAHFTDYPLDVAFLCSTEKEEQRLKEKLVEYGAPDFGRFLRGYLSSGFVLPDLQLVAIPQPELTHRHRIRRQKMRGVIHTTPSDLFALTPGELVVHYQNGIGKYLGIETRPNAYGVDTEYLIIEYAENGKLYVPLTQAHLITKYIGTQDERPTLHTIGSSRWKNIRSKTEAAIVGYASQLLKMYAERSLKGGFAYPEDTLEMLQLEEEFPYEETHDQREAIAAIKHDMESPKAMDRLVCGDTGYGKTEVAMRAIAKAVLCGGKQVAVLVPTTVLALQHYENMVDRMRNTPIRLGILSRFNSPKEIKKTLKGLAEGSIDVVIGTHRLLSQDITFKNLGLIVIDEEQRFGVRAKEKLKALKVGVDSLALSATPIPRTLYMSLVGARDMSLINTPPQDRLPIKTIICESDDEMIKNALMRELARDGQAYLIHNHVDTIYQFAEKIRTLVPNAKIVVGHGQMESDEIDAVFHAFKSGAANILIATTIVENGLDIPNANTILIDRADRFGLADLYQLRGRVGRWNKRAYAYFLLPKGRRLPELSQKRLQAMAETGGYGGGMKIAMRDLEIRGAGDILGTEQSGHVSAVGFHLYCKLLRKTVDAMRHKVPITITDAKVEFPQPAKLPETYVNDPGLRMELYQRLGETVSLADIDAIRDELQDRFGPLPPAALWLYHLTRLRLFAGRHHFTLIKLENVTLFAEQRLGKNSVTHQILFKAPESPHEMERAVVQALTKAFGLQTV